MTDGPVITVSSSVRLQLFFGPCNLTCKHYIAQHIIDHYFTVIVPTSCRLFPEPVLPTDGETLAISTRNPETDIIIQPVGAPPTFTLAAAAQLLRDSKEDKEMEEPPVNIHPEEIDKLPS